MKDVERTQTEHHIISELDKYVLGVDEELFVKGLEFINDFHSSFSHTGFILATPEGEKAFELRRSLLKEIVVAFKIYRNAIGATADAT